MRPLKFDNTEESVRFVARHYQPGRFDSRKAWLQMGTRTGFTPKWRSLVPLWRAAAVVIILITAGIGYLTAERGDTLIAGQDRTQFTLPDDSRIEMQKGAILEYDKHFDKDERRVTMQGEITFAVARDKAKPFIVSTPAAQIEVLGTEFTVRADDDETRLSVASGIVRFTPDDPVIPLLCTAGMTVHYNAGTGIVNVSSPDSEMEINGKTRSLTFDNMRLKEIVMVLSHFYDVPIELPDSESHLTFSSSFTQASLIEIINIINLTLDTHITINHYNETSYSFVTTDHLLHGVGGQPEKDHPECRKPAGYRSPSGNRGTVGLHILVQPFAFKGFSLDNHPDCGRTARKSITGALW